MKNKIIVNNCNDCPFCNSDNEYGLSCNYPESGIEDYEMPRYDSEEVPKKCPLLKNAVIVELNKK